MNRPTQRLFALILIFLLCAAALPTQVFATPQTHPNNHINTGDQRADVIAIALTQVGYREGANNDTKYGVWYGYNNIGWCGIFVAWCANQAGVPTSVLARTGLAQPSAYGLTAEPQGYIPKSGDLFFSKDHGHVGFVYYVEGNDFYSLEGNTWENGPQGVYIRKHAISSMEFASPKYQGGGGHSYVLTTETAHPHKEIYRCSDCGDQYYTGKTSQRSDCTVCIQNACSHNFGSYTQVSDTQHSRTCSLCSKQETVNHVWNAGITQQAATCGQPGTKIKTCLECGLEALHTIPATGNHSYTDWTVVDESSHTRTCNSCGKEETLSHDRGDNWQTDANQHWFACQTCLQQVGKESHTFGEACDSPCAVCGYFRPGGHPFEEKYDTQQHWLCCKNCQLEKDREDHVFSTDCDETCDSCGYVRETQHSFSHSFSSDSENHWYRCTVCDKQTEIQKHTPEPLLREGAIQRCSVCQYVLTPEAVHTHDYDAVYIDGDVHWGSCSCGEEMPRQAHQWSVRTNTCSVCGVNMPQRQSDIEELIPWIGIGAGILVAGVLLPVLVLRKKK